MRGTRMRAAWYDQTGPANEVLTVGEIFTPEPDVGQVLVKVAASGINPHDVKARAGLTGAKMRADRVIPHFDGAGEIVACGAGVDPGRIGQRVWMFRVEQAREGGGTAADYAVCNALHTIALPDSAAFEVGAGLGVPGLTAHVATIGAGCASGMTVLVQGGAGAVAQYAIQFSRWAGARVIATVSGACKAEVAREAGADLAVNYRTDDVAQAVLDFTGGAGADLIVEVDFAANLACDLRALKVNGTIASYSSPSDPAPIVRYMDLAMKGATVHFIQGMFLTEEKRAHAARDITMMLERNLLVHPKSIVFPLSQIIEAHEALEKGTEGRKIIVTP